MTTGDLAIARHVVDEYIKAFGSVFFGTGVAVATVAAEVFGRKKMFLTAGTNSMKVYKEYVKAPSKNELNIFGGRYVERYDGLFGKEILKSIEEFFPNIIIFDADGLNRDGFMCHGEEEVVIRKSLLTKPTDVRIILADWDTIGRKAAHKFGNICDVNAHSGQAGKTIIVTAQPPEDTFEAEEFYNEVAAIKALKSGIKIDVI